MNKDIEDALVLVLQPIAKEAMKPNLANDNRTGIRVSLAGVWLTTAFMRLEEKYGKEAIMRVNKRLW